MRQLGFVIIVGICLTLVYPSSASAKKREYDAICSSPHAKVSDILEVDDGFSEVEEFVSCSCIDGYVASGFSCNPISDYFPGDPPDNTGTNPGDNENIGGGGEPTEPPPPPKDAKCDECAAKKWQSNNRIGEVRASCLREKAHFAWAQCTEDLTTYTGVPIVKLPLTGAREVEEIVDSKGMFDDYNVTPTRKQSDASTYAAFCNPIKDEEKSRVVGRDVFVNWCKGELVDLCQSISMNGINERAIENGFSTGVEILVNIGSDARKAGVGFSASETNKETIRFPGNIGIKGLCAATHHRLHDRVLQEYNSCLEKHMCTAPPGGSLLPLFRIVSISKPELEERVAGAIVEVDSDTLPRLATETQTSIVWKGNHRYSNEHNMTYRLRQTAVNNFWQFVIESGISQEKIRLLLSSLYHAQAAYEDWNTDVENKAAELGRLEADSLYSIQQDNAEVIQQLDAYFSESEPTIELVAIENQLLKRIAENLTEEEFRQFSVIFWPGLRVFGNAQPLEIRTESQLTEPNEPEQEVQQ